MNKIKSVDELLALRDKVKSKVKVREQGEHIEDLTTVTVFMGESGYNAGAKDIFHYFTDVLDTKDTKDVVVLQKDGSDQVLKAPVVSISIPSKQEVFFEQVSKEKVDEIIKEFF